MLGQRRFLVWQTLTLASDHVFTLISSIFTQHVMECDDSSSLEANSGVDRTRVTGPCVCQTTRSSSDNANSLTNANANSRVTAKVVNMIC